MKAMQREVDKRKQVQILYYFVDTYTVLMSFIVL